MASNSIEVGGDQPTGGYFGRHLRVDVTSGTATQHAISGTVLRQFLGGSGLGTYLLQQEGVAAVDAFDQHAALCFVFSPLVGSPLTTSAKFAVVGKSPLTHRINDSLASSQFAITGKRTGHDAIVITGRASEPSILVIDHDTIRLEPAAELWGQDIPDSEATLRERYGAEFSFATIGPAGERLVRYATISHDGRHAGRGGSGAVLGSKNIKAVAVRGTRRCNWANPDRLVDFAKQLSQRSLGPATAKYRELGTLANLLVFNRLHALPTRNFQRGSFEQASQLSPESLAITRSKTRSYCAACTIGCEHLYSLDSPDGTTTNTRIEYENLFALGPLCNIGNPDVVLAASRRCDALGIDTISAGGTIAFAMECVERGLIDEPWLRFGDPQALQLAIEQIVSRKGIGDLLAEGTRVMSQTIGHDSDQFAAHVKGLEIPGYEPRSLQTMALGFAVGTRGADHNRSGAYEADFSSEVDRRNLSEASVRRAIETEDGAAIMDSLILCKFLRGVFSDYYGELAEMLNLVTGWDVTSEELRMIAKQIVTAKKQFNVAAGWVPEEDRLPARFLNVDLPDDADASLNAEQLQTAIRRYNELRGWDSDGYPPLQESPL